MVEQRGGEVVQLGAVAGGLRGGPVGLFVEDAGDLLVDEMCGDMCGLIGVVAGVDDVLATRPGTGARGCRRAPAGDLAAAGARKPNKARRRGRFDREGWDLWPWSAAVAKSQADIGYETREGAERLRGQGNLVTGELGDP